MEPASNEAKEYPEYKENPDGLFKVARDKLNKSLYEEGISILEKAIHYAIEKYGSEKDIHLAMFYNRYAEGIIRKILETQDILNEKEVGDEAVNENPKNPSQKEDNSTEENLSDEEIILINLLSANGIYLQYLTPFDSENDITKLKEEVIKMYKELAFNYLMFGEFEKAKSDFPKAAEYYLKAVNIRNKYDTTFSRELAELYFNLAFVYDNDPQKCMLSYFKAKTIMEYHLSEELKNAGSPIKLSVNAEDLKLDQIGIEDERIFKNRKMAESEEVMALKEKNDEIEDLVYILNSLYTKLEDCIEEIKQFELYQKEKKKLIEQQPQTGSFTENYDKSKVVDITKTLVVKKKRPLSPSKAEIKSEKGDDSKIAKVPEKKDTPKK